MLSRAVYQSHFVVVQYSHTAFNRVHERPYNVANDTNIYLLTVLQYVYFDLSLSINYKRRRHMHGHYIILILHSTKPVNVTICEAAPP